MGLKEVQTGKMVTPKQSDEHIPTKSNSKCFGVKVHAVGYNQSYYFFYFYQLVKSGITVLRNREIMLGGSLFCQNDSKLEGFFIVLQCICWNKGVINKVLQCGPKL